VLRLYHATATRSLRIVWLLEELGLPHEIVSIDFTPPARPFVQPTPSGKLPVLEDGPLTMFESGAILEYVLERYGAGRLAPAPGTPERGTFLQWVHFAEASMMPPLGDIVRHLYFLPEAERIPALLPDARMRMGATLGVVERALAGKEYLVGDAFSGADVMMGYPLLSARLFGILTDEYPNLQRYLARLEARPAFQRAVQR
jgi:glutathione S-transferase